QTTVGSASVPALSTLTTQASSTDVPRSTYLSLTVWGQQAQCSNANTSTTTSTTSVTVTNSASTTTPSSSASSTTVPNCDVPYRLLRRDIVGADSDGSATIHATVVVPYADYDQFVVEARLQSGPTTSANAIPLTGCNSSTSTTVPPSTTSTGTTAAPTTTTTS